VHLEKKNSRLKRTQPHFVPQYRLEVIQFPEYDEPYINVSLQMDIKCVCDVKIAIIFVIVGTVISNLRNSFYHERAWWNYGKDMTYRVRYNNIAVI